jgi:hypothetical protein
LNLAKVMELSASFYAPLTLPSPPFCGEDKGEIDKCIVFDMVIIAIGGILWEDIRTKFWK